MDESVNILTENKRNTANERLAEVSRLAKLPPMSESKMQRKVSCGGIQLTRKSENLFLKRVVLVAQAILDTVPGILFLIKNGNPCLSCLTLPKQWLLPVVSRRHNYRFRKNERIAIAALLKPRHHIKLPGWKEKYYTNTTTISDRM